MAVRAPQAAGDAARKSPSTRLGEAAVPVAWANRRSASAALADAPHRLRPPSCPADRPGDLYGSLSALIGMARMKRLRPYLKNGFLELDNNTAERSMRPIALGRKNYLFMGSERGGKSAAIAYTLIETAKLSGVDPQAWLTNVLGRIGSSCPACGS